MYEDDQDPAEEIASPQALASALQYLHAEAKLAGFEFVAHLIEAAATAVEEDMKNSGEQADLLPPPRPTPPRLRLLQGGKTSMAAMPADAKGK